MKDFFFFFFAGLGVRGKGAEALPSDWPKVGEDSRDLFFLPYPYNRETDIQEKLPEGFRRVRGTWIPNFYWRAWNRLYTFVNEIGTREAGRDKINPQILAEFLPEGKCQGRKNYDRICSLME